MGWLEAVILGIVQGLTEFLPISSSAHVLIVSRLFGWGDPGAAFTAVTQIGTEIAVLVYFRRDLARIASTWSPPSPPRAPPPSGATFVSPRACFDLGVCSWRSVECVSALVSRAR